MEGLGFTPFQERALRLLEDSNTKCRGRHSLRNSIYHLKKAWELRAFDLEMAAFRGITAEEEAATGLFHALKFREYEHSDLIRPTDHKNKAAAVPFLQILSSFFYEILGKEEIWPYLHIADHEEEERLFIGLTLNMDGQYKAAYPIPPLNFEGKTDGKFFSYRKQIEEFIERVDNSSIISYVNNRSNLRNKILYASGGGYPLVNEITDNFFIKKEVISWPCCTLSFSSNHGLKYKALPNIL